jgi:hypothetical protein
LLTILLFCLLFQFLSRFAAAPVADLTSDAWGMLAWSAEQPSMAATWKLGLSEPDRPVQASILSVTFRRFGDDAWRYAVLSIVAYSVFLALGIALIHLLSGSSRAALAFGIFFSLFPNLTESFHWGAMITVSYMQVAYMACALAWAMHLRTGRAGWLILSAACYGIGVASYEFGIALPFVLLLLVPLRSWPRCLPKMAPFIAVLAAYLAWRFTQGFGNAHGVLFAPRKLDIASVPVAWNAVEVVRWWIGSHMFDAVRNGWNAFASLPAMHQRLLALCNLAAIVLVVQALRRDEPDAPARPPLVTLGRLFLFGLGWAAAGHALNLISWTAPRLNFYPAIGVAIALAALVAATENRRWLAAFAVLAFAALIANQGTAKAWQDSGVLQRRLFDYIQRHADELRQYDVVILDTGALRQRQTDGLLSPALLHVDSWAQHGNACLIRSFVPEAMMKLAFPAAPRPRSVIDTEGDAQLVDDVWKWHEPWRPAEAHVTPRAKVATLDVFAIGSGALD